MDVRVLEKRIGFYHVFPFQKIKKGERIIIWGMGEVGHHYLKQIELTKYCKVLFAVDKKPTMERIGEVKIYSPDKIKHCYNDTTIVIANGNSGIARSIKKELRKWNIREERIVWDDLICESDLFTAPLRLSHKLELPDDKVNVGFLVRGGLGDYCVHANYIHKLIERYQDGIMQVDVYVRNGWASAKAVFGNSEAIHALRLEEEYQEGFREYDLFIDLSRYPDIQYKNWPKIAELAPELLEYVSLCERFRDEYNRFYKYAGILDGQSAKFEIVQGRKRIQQPDVYGFLGITEEYEHEVSIERDEDSYLEKSGILKKKYILFHRGNDTRHDKDCVKLWPKAYYDILAGMLKEKWPDVMLIQIGVSPERCPEMENMDLNLVGRTSLEDIKLLLKNALLHVDGEGGFAHLRHALHGGKSVILFGPTSRDFYGYSENINILGEGCATWCEWTCHDWFEHCSRGAGTPPCMASIAPEMVFECIDRYLRESEAAHE